MGYSTIRIALALVGLGLLGSDIAQDLDFFGKPEMRTAAYVVSALVRNLLMVAAIIFTVRGGRYGPLLLLTAAVVGSIRRGAFLLPIFSTMSLRDPQWLGFHSGLDVAFRILLIALAVDIWRGSKNE